MESNNPAPAVQLSASMICMDQCNLQSEIKKIEALNIDFLHVDLIDGYFSPSMPIGLDTIKCVRKITKLPFDVHVMAKHNEFFINTLLDIGVQRLCFQYETEIHVDHMISKIKNAGVLAGVVLAPSMPISVLEYIIDQCDFIVLMLINPGFADNSNENQVPYAQRKIRDVKDFIDKHGCDTLIEVDGRVSFSTIPGLIQAGANTLVLGTSSLFNKSHNIEENFQKINKLICKVL